MDVIPCDDFVLPIAFIQDYYISMGCVSVHLYGPVWGGGKGGGGRINQRTTRRANLMVPRGRVLNGGQRGPK